MEIGEGVSVVIPLYNKVNYVGRAISSVQNQSVGRVREIIVVDDGSTDGGAEVVSGMAHEDSRIRLLVQGNSGVSVARNCGAAAARAHLVGFLDADDAWAPTFIEDILCLTMKYPQCRVYATAYEYELEGGLRYSPRFRAMPTCAGGGVVADYFLALGSGDPPLCSSAVCVRRDTFLSEGGFPVGVTHAEDLVLWSRLALRHDMAWSPRPGATYHVGHPGQSSDAWRPEKGQIFLVELESLLSACDDDSRFPRSSLQLAIARQHRSIYFSSLENGFRRAATHELLWLLRHDTMAGSPVLLGRYLIPTAVKQVLVNLVRRFGARGGWMFGRHQ